MHTIVFKRAFVVRLVALVGFLVPFEVSGQFETAEIVGTIRDASGAAASGAKVTLRNLDSNVMREFTADSRGNYFFPSLRIGKYEVTATLPGFKVAKAGDLALRIGDRLRVDLSLSPGDVHEQISVIGRAPLLETETSSRGQVVTGEVIRELPLNKRDYSQLVLLSPGTVRDPRARLGGSMNINGNRQMQNNYMLDGADNNSNATSFRGERVDVILPSVDALAEFKVQTNSYSAEFGRSAGAVINATIKSGGNQLHGGAWEFLRNSLLDAHGWTPTNPRSLKPDLRFNLFGANVGGPIIKDKTFFFLNYEGQRERSSATYVGSVATPEMQRGILANVDPSASAALRNAPVDPTSGGLFPGAVIPLSRWDPVAARILSDPSFPKPTTPGGVIGNNYTRTVANRLNSDKFDVRLDHYLSSRWKLFGRYSFSDLNQFRPTIFPGLAEGGTNDAFGTTATRGQNAILGPTVIVNPTTIADIRLGYTRLGANVFPVNFGTPGPAKLLGIPNSPDSPRINGGWPLMSVEGLNNFGRTTSTPQFQIPNVFLAKSTFSLLRGAHSIKTGFDGQYIQTAILDVSALIGSYTFRRNTFSNNSWADFLLGEPAVVRLTSVNVLYDRKTIYAFFLQDDFRVRPDLTLNLGLRYEYGTPRRDKYNRMANFDRQTGKLRFATAGSIEERALVAPDRRDWAPRVGFAWSALPGFVVRGGYGIFYAHTNRQGREGLLGMNPPFVTDLTRLQTRSTANPITLSGGLPLDFFANPNPIDLGYRGNDPNLQTGYTQQWNFTLQRALFKDWLVEVGYVGNRGNKLTRFYNANQAYAPGPPALQSRVPYPSYGNIQFMDSGGSSKFHSLQTRVEKRWASGFSLLHSFTFGRALENVGAWSDNGAERVPQNAYDYRSEWGLAGMNVKFNSVISWVYELPFGHSKKYLSQAPRMVDTLLGGWEVSGIWNWRTGLPINISSNECGPDCQMGSERSERADVVAGVDWRLPNPSATQWFNTKAFKEPTGPFGTAGRNIVYGPGFHAWDLSFAKNFRFAETRQLQFRSEWFNAFNQVNYDAPSNNVSSGSFGRIATALDGRSLQFGLKFYW